MTANVLDFITRHALDRANERMAEAGIPYADRVSILRSAIRTAHAARPGESVAVRVAIPAMVGQAWSDRSNGDTVVAIIRDRAVQTVMLRRSSQPFTTAALNVDRLTIIA